MKLKDPLNEREFELINIVAGQIAANQRDLSRHMNLSLGMTNMLIKRLVTKGYIRIKQLNHRKVEYLLTPKGFSEKMQKSLNYTRKTINSITLVRSSLSTLLKGLYGQGIRTFYILGGVDLAGLIEMTIKEELPSDVKALRINELPAALKEGVILNCQEDDQSLDSSMKIVNIIEELARDEALIGPKSTIE